MPLVSRAAVEDCVVAEFSVIVEFMGSTVPVMQ